MTKNVTLQLNVDELNLVLVALGQLPYAQVHELIARLQSEVGPQLVAAVNAEKSNGRDQAQANR